MRYSCKKSVEYDLMMHYRLRDQYSEELKARDLYKNCFLKRQKGNNGNYYYSVKMPEADKYAYRGNVVDQDIALAKEYAFYKKAVEVIEFNIGLLEDFLRVYKRTHAENINELLKGAYSISRPQLMTLENREADEWLQRVRREKNKFPVFDEAGLTVTAFDGTKVRSRAEALHLEGFYIYDVPVVFECPYKINGEIYRPDFTTLDTFLMKTKIWEHLGNWFHTNDLKRNNYRREAIDRIDAYSKIGYYPESNLLLTFGSMENILDIQALLRKIAMIASPPPDEETLAILKRS